MPLPPPISIESTLVPDDPPQAPAGLRRELRSLDTGLPAFLALDALWNLVVAAPSGLAGPWLSRNPALTVSSSAEEAVARSGGAGDAVARAPIRLIVRASAIVVGSLPLVVGAKRTFSVDAGPLKVLELAILGWDIRVATIRGAGAQGAFLELAWRVGGPSPVFDNPKPDPRVLDRLINNSSSGSA